MTNVKDPVTLNYAVTCTVLNLNNPIPETRFVDYQAKPNFIQKRLPAGRFQASDLTKSVEEFLTTKGRNTSLEYLCGTIMRLESNFNISAAELTDFAEINPLFNEYTNKLLVELQSCNLSEDDFFEILSNAHKNSAKRELKEEILAGPIGSLHLASVSSNDGIHYKIGFVSVDTESPEFYEGSADRKILKSYKVEIDENTTGMLWNGHSMNFQEAIRTTIDEKLYPGAKNILEKYLTAVR